MSPYPSSIYGTHGHSYAPLVGLAAAFVLFQALMSFASGSGQGYFLSVLYLAAAIALITVAMRAGRDRRQREEIYRRGVELEAEILARYEAGALQGSDLAKARQVMGSSEDPLELQLRYTLDGREIVSRGQVPVDLFFRSRGMKNLKIKILPDRPESWVPLG